jgi:hypothetical protein
MSKFQLAYRGPRAWLIWVNLVISCSILIPFLAEGLIRLILTGKMTVGDSSHIVVLIALLPLLGVAQAGYVLCAPFLLGACILLVTPKIPWRVKLPTVAVELSAGALLFWDVGRLTIFFKTFRI